MDIINNISYDNITISHTVTREYNPIYELIDSSSFISKSKIISSSTSSASSICAISTMFSDTAICEDSISISSSF